MTRLKMSKIILTGRNPDPPPDPPPLKKKKKKKKKVQQDSNIDERQLIM